MFMQDILNVFVNIGKAFLIIYIFDIDIHFL